MAEYFTLEPLVVGMFPAFPLAKFLHGFEGADTVAAPCISWLARGSEGSLVLVDTGPPQPTPETAAFHVGLQVDPEYHIDAALQGAGVSPEEITIVVFSHLHFDHCAHGEFLPNARFLVQRSELAYAVVPEPRHRSGYEVGYRKVFPAWMKAFDRFATVEGHVEVTDGCMMLHLPGHSPGSAGAVFRTRAGHVAVVGDLVNQIENWAAPGGGHIAPSLHSDLAACKQSFRVLEKEADIVLASHDARMLG
jgi:N-acyl homoserine lactone hydrolase